MGFVLSIALLLGACSAGPLSLVCHEHGSSPYSHERPTVPFHVTMTDSRGVDSWNSDGAPTVLTVHNPTDKFLEVHVQCWPSVPPSYIDYGLHEATYCMKPHSEKVRLVEFMNRDAITQVCSVDHYVQTSPDFCTPHEQ